MAKQQTAACRVESFDDVTEPGQFILTSRIGTDAHTGMLFSCPCGCGAFSGVSFDVPEAKGLSGPKWKWNGSETSPTVSPSIRRIDGCKWHGWLRDGVFVEC